MPKVQYVCTLCNSGYSNEADALKCEASHVKPEYVRRAVFRNCNNDGPYPVSVVVHMTDGVDKIYKRA